MSSEPKLGSQGTPTTPSTYVWLNQVEPWFGIITQLAGSFSSFREPVSRIELFIEHDNAKAVPFRWTATADSSIRIQRLCADISETQY